MCDMEYGEWFILSPNTQPNVLVSPFGKTFLYLLKHLRVLAEKSIFGALTWDVMLNKSNVATPKTTTKW